MMREKQDLKGEKTERANLPELLAPAGNLDCLKAAVGCGADAVYVGARAFSARAGANNFSAEELSEAAEYCHLRGAKLHLALNTLLFDREYRSVLPLLKQACDIGVDAVIVQDLGLARLIREVAPELALHASTQMSIHSLGGALAAKELGFSRVVLAREMSREEIARTAEAGIETEIFVHGALCVCYSGQCLMSSFLGGRSGNRGRCAQPCRLKYSAGKWQEKTLLSPKDYCLLPHLPEICAMGIDSLKIEGRMKGPDYVSVVVTLYRKYLDSGAVPTEDDLRFLKDAFNRGGYTDGYFTGKTGCEMFCFDKPENPYYKQSKLDQMPEKKISAQVEYSFHAGEPAVLTAKSGDGAQVSVRSADPVDAAQKTPTSEERIRQQLQKTGDTVYRAERLAGECGDDVFVPIGTLNALRRELFEKLDEARLDQSRGRTWVEPPENIDDCLDETSPAERPGERLTSDFKGSETAANGQLDGTNLGSNVDWRQAHSGAKERLCQNSQMADCARDTGEIHTNRPVFTVEIQTLEQWKAVRSFPAARFYVPAHLAGKIDAGEPSDRLWYVLPRILNEAQVKKVQTLLKNAGVTRIVAGNLGHLVDFRGYEIHGGMGLNVTNGGSLRMIKGLGAKSAALSPEMSMPQVRSLCMPLPLEYLIYGKVSLMVTENCLAESIWKTEGCTYQCETPSLTDRKGETFRLLRHGNACRTELINCVPLYLADKQEELERLPVAYRLIRFTDEMPDDCVNILNLYQGKPGQKPMRITRGYFLKNLE